MGLAVAAEAGGWSGVEVLGTCQLMMMRESDGVATAGAAKAAVACLLGLAVAAEAGGWSGVEVLGTCQLTMMMRESDKVATAGAT